MCIRRPDFEKINVVYKMYKVSKDKCCVSDIQILKRQILCIRRTDFKKANVYLQVSNVH